MDGRMDVMSIETSAEPEADLPAFPELSQAEPGALAGSRVRAKPVAWRGETSVGA